MASFEGTNDCGSSLRGYAKTTNSKSHMIRQQQERLAAYRRAKAQAAALEAAAFAHKARLSENLSLHDDDDCPESNYNTDQIGADGVEEIDYRRPSNIPSSWHAYERNWARFESPDQGNFSYSSIPWPPDTQQLLCMTARLLVQQQRGTPAQQATDAKRRPADWKQAYRRAYISASLRWHPDKFTAKHGARISNANEVSRISERLLSTTQSLNRQWAEHKSQAPN